MIDENNMEMAWKHGNVSLPCDNSGNLSAKNLFLKAIFNYLFKNYEMFWITCILLNRSVVNVFPSSLMI